MTEPDDARTAPAPGTPRPAAPRPGPRARAALGYALAAALAAGGAAWLFRVGSGADLGVPLVYESDGFYYLAMNKTIQETGWYYFNDRVGQLGGLDYREFPTGDGWAHLGVVALLTRCGLDPFQAANVFYLLGYPLAAVSALFVGRRLGLSYPAGLMVALLYAFQPYHVWRVWHPYLAAYYFVPLAVLLAVRVHQGRLPFQHADGRGWTIRTPAAAGTVAVAALVGAGGVYYAFFGGFFLTVAGAVRARAERRWAPALSAGAVVAAVLGALAVTMAPPVAYKLTHSANSDAALRRASESEDYGLKIVQMLMPVTGHRVPRLRLFKDRYSLGGTPLVNENDAASLGAVGALGFVALLARPFLCRPGRGRLLDGLALLTLAGVLLGTVGGGGAVLSWAVSPWIRAYNRVSIFLAFFALLAVGVWLDALGHRFGRTRARRAALAAGAVGLAAAGLYDQTTPRAVRSRRAVAEQFRTDREFVARVEAAAPRGGVVFQLPHAGYPERLLPSGVQAYAMFRPYLHSAHLRWSFGGLSGHPGDEWGRGLAARPAGDMLARLAEAGVVGVCVDRDGYPDRGAAVESDLRAALGGTAPAESEDGRQAYYDLEPFAARLRAGVPAAEWAARCERARNPVVPLRRNGFHPASHIKPEVLAPLVQGGYERWCSGSGELHLTNALSRPRAVRLRVRVSTPARAGRSEFPLRVQCAGWSETVGVGPGPRTVEHVLGLPPGETVVVRLSCPAPPVVAPAAPLRDLVFALHGVECEELPWPN